MEVNIETIHLDKFINLKELEDGTFIAYNTIWNSFGILERPTIERTFVKHITYLKLDEGLILTENIDNSHSVQNEIKKIKLGNIKKT